MLYTSGTTSEPKSALLRHRHLMAYLLGSVEFGGAGEDEAVLVAVPPYHVAGMANMLSNLFAGRRLVYLAHFEPQRVARHRSRASASPTPWSCRRCCRGSSTRSTGQPADVPTLRTLSYGGAKISERVLLDALRLFPTRASSTPTA